MFYTIKLFEDMSENTIVAFKNHYYGWYHFYGHVHKTWEDVVNMMESRGVMCKMINVGVGCDWMDLRPKSFEELEGMIDEKKIFG